MCMTKSRFLKLSLTRVPGAGNEGPRSFKITEAFLLLKAPTSAFTLKNINNETLRLAHLYLRVF